MPIRKSSTAKKEFASGVFSSGESSVVESDDLASPKVERGNEETIDFTND